MLDKICGRVEIVKFDSSYHWPESRYRVQINPMIHRRLASGWKNMVHFRWFSGEGSDFDSAIYNALAKLSESSERPSFREPILDELFPVPS